MKSGNLEVYLEETLDWTRFIASEAACCPPRPNDSPRARDTATKKPVNKVWMNAPAMPICDRATRIAKTQTAHRDTDESRFAEDSPAVLAEAITIRDRTSPTTAPTRRISTAMISCGK